MHRGLLCVFGSICRQSTCVVEELPGLIEEGFQVQQEGIRRLRQKGDHDNLDNRLEEEAEEPVHDMGNKDPKHTAVAAVAVPDHMVDVCDHRSIRPSGQEEDMLKIVDLIEVEEEAGRCLAGQVAVDLEVGSRLLR